MRLPFIRRKPRRQKWCSDCQKHRDWPHEVRPTIECWTRINRFGLWESRRWPKNCPDWVEDDHLPAPLKQHLRVRYKALFRNKGYAWAQRTMTLTHRGYYMWREEFKPFGYTGYYDDEPTEEFIASDGDMSNLLEPLPANPDWPGDSMEDRPTRKQVLVARIRADAEART